MIIQLAWLYEAFFLFDLSLGLAWTTAAFTNPRLEEALLLYLGWIGALTPGIHALALGRAAMVRRFIVVLPIFALCGEAFFTRLAREFQQAHPSACGDLHYVGEPFPPYLRQRFDGGDHAYFADVAALEWAREQAARAADAPPLDLAKLGAHTAADAAGSRIRVHPAVRLTAPLVFVVAAWLVQLLIS